jgi:hypothetical protein
VRYLPPEVVQPLDPNSLACTRSPFIDEAIQAYYSDLL